MMTVKQKRTWLEILRQIPTVTLITIVFVGGGWKNHVDATLAENCETLVLYDQKGEALQWRVIELEAVVREYRAQAQARDARLDEMNGKLDRIYEILMEDR